MTGILMLESLTRGNTLKQGDLSILKYRLYDADGDTLNVSGKPATVRLMKKGFTFIAYEKEGLMVSSDNTVSFNINKVIPGGRYHLEVIVDDKYVFPSRGDEGQFNVDRSSLGVELNIIESAGIDAVVRKAIDLINEDPGLILDEERLVNEIIANTPVGSIEEYYQVYRDAIREYADLKPKALNAISKSDEALTKSQNALNVANGIDAKATEALSKSTDADVLSKSVQSQLNQVVIDGDSSVEAAQARVDASGRTNATLKERLDKEHTEVAAQLARTELEITERVKHEDLTTISGGLVSTEVKPKIQAHRGASDLYPENTILAFKEAFKIGADAIEVDVWKTVDDEFVVIHDGNVDRTTNGTGWIEYLTSDYVLNLDASYETKFGNQFTGRIDTKVPSLDEILYTFYSKKIVLHINFSATNEDLENLVNKIMSLNMKDNVMFFGRLDDINYIKNYSPTCFAFNSEMPTISNYQSFIDNAVLNNLDAVSIDIKTSSILDIKTMVQAIHNAGLEAHGSYLSDDYSTKTYDLIDTGIDYILTNAPDVSRSIVDSKFPKIVSEIRMKQMDIKDTLSLKENEIGVSDRVYIGSSSASEEIITRKRLYEILSSISSGEDVQISVDGFSDFNQPDTWEQGSITGVTGEETTFPNRIRTGFFYNYDTKVKVKFSFNVDYKINFFFYSKDGYIGTSGWVNSDEQFYSFPDDVVRFRVIFGKDDEIMTPETIAVINPDLTLVEDWS